ncbi:MAG: 50S ribosomal protein L11 methyltransferase, partial [Methyloversatilis sp.]|nr:50S ribosomal protein L11 methyltransferase [Methyloversatilis sp.]
MSADEQPVGAAGGWITVTLLADSLHAEALSDALLDAGALSVDIEDADAGTPDEKPQFGEPGLP